MMRKVCVLSGVALLVGAACPPDAIACNIGVADGSVSQDGRGLLFKERMTTDTTYNQVAHFAGPEYDYVGVRGVGSGEGAWMGLNEAGLCTGNSYVARWNNNTLMNQILGNYSTVAEVRDFIQQEFNAGTLSVTGCFPFMDAAGNTTIFEINYSDWVIEYDTQDPDREPQGLLGWVVRANEFHNQSDGTDDTSIGGRYESAAENVDGLIGLGLLSAKTVVQGNDGVNGCEYLRYGPGRPLDTLAPDRVRSSIVVQGVLPGEDAAVSTMWVVLGQANYGIAVPTWASVSDIPEPLSSGDLAARARSLFNKGDEATTQASTFPFETHLFEEIDELLEHWRSEGVSSVDEMSRVEDRMADDAYSLLDCLDNVQEDNQAPTVAMNATSTSHLTLDFEMTAADEDGSVQAQLWNFGDDETSTEPSPSHTYDAPGWYLASVTVTDDDGVSSTDWQYRGVLPCDLGGDCRVDVGDLGELLSNYGTTSGATYGDGDVYPDAGDGMVNISDLGEMLAVYGTTCE